jgi:Domain of unknown function (DUF4178)
MTTLTELTPGTVLTVRGRRARIRGSVWLEQQDFVWSEHLLDLAEPGAHWLSVEQDDALTLTTWETRADLLARPEGRIVRLDGRTWRRQEKGTANFMVEGELHYPPAGTCEYHDYRAGEQRLSFERFGGGAWEVSLGRTITAADVRIEEG